MLLWSEAVGKGQVWGLGERLEVTGIRNGEGCYSQKEGGGVGILVTHCGCCWRHV